MGALASGGVTEGHGAATTIACLQISECRCTVQMGTLGAGNHYAEIQVVEEIFDKPAARKMGIDRIGQVWPPSKSAAVARTPSSGFAHAFLLVLPLARACVQGCTPRCRLAPVPSTCAALSSDLASLPAPHIYAC